MVNLAELLHNVGPALVPVNPASRRSVVVGGVHISELRDPTPYLEGGEMLLTTGMAFVEPGTQFDEYVSRLVDRGVCALVFGVGPHHDEVPIGLLDACDAAAMPLLVVPQEHPFRTVVAGYWGLLATEGQASLVQHIGLQTSVVRAAARSDGIAAVVQIVAQAMGGWVIVSPFDGSEPTVWPEKASGVIPSLRPELQRFAERDDVGSMSFPLHGYDVVAYPISRGSKPVAAFVVGTTRRLARSDRQVMLTAAAVLSVRANTTSRPHAGEKDVRTVIASLLLDGEVSAARALSSAAGAPPIPPSLRVFAAAPGREGRAPHEWRPVTPNAEDVVAELVRRGLIPLTSGSFLVAEHHGSEVVLIDELTGAVPKRGDRAPVALTGYLTDSSPVSRVYESATAAAGFARQASEGQVLTASDVRQRSAGAEAATALRAYRRASLVEAVQSYIRHRGSWEAAARDLGVHRNTIRNRVQIARKTLGIDLDDPDIAADLWIALRGPVD
jgi:purine catabolism regulator